MHFPFARSTASQELESCRLRMQEKPGNSWGVACSILFVTRAQSQGARQLRVIELGREAGREGALGSAISRQFETDEVGNERC